jgi:hypothetical protein
MSRTKGLLFLLPLLLFGVSILGYTQTTFITISGAILDKETSTPIPFANVGIAGKSIGTVSNTDGAFIFKFPAIYQKDSLKVSFTGYQSYIKPIVSIGNEPITIYLTPATVQLQEVQVQAKGKSALDILKEAVAAVPVNYDTSSIQMLAFYREDTKLGEEEIVYVESVLDINRPAYASKETNDQIKAIKERRKKIDHSKDIHFYIWLQLGGGAMYALRNTDMVRGYKLRPKYSFYDSRIYRHYEYTLKGIIHDGQRSVYVIDMLPKKNSRKGWAKGRYHIDVQTLAFTKWEWELTQVGIDRENNRKLALKKIGEAFVKANLKLTSAKEIATFEQYNGKWYTKDIHRHFEALVNSKKRNMEDRLWKTDVALTVTDINKSNSQSGEGIYTANNSASKLMNTEKGDNFWANFNVISSTKASISGEFREYTDSTYAAANKIQPIFSNRDNGFTRADTLRGKLTPLRTCYDVSFYDLDIKVDIDNKFITGSNTIRFKVTEPFNKMQVDLYTTMQIHKIVYKQKEVPYTREFNAVFIQFPETLQPDAQQEITIYYSGKPKEPNRDIPMDGGFLWDKDKEGNPWVQVVCQGSGASLWWPTKDHLSDEPDSVRIAVTVPKGLMNISNGRLRNTTELSDNWTKYEWYVSYPINNYNVTLNIGKYTHLQDTYVTTDTLTLDYYIMPYNLEKGKVIFNQVKSMLASLEGNYGKYPFPRDGFKLMESLYPMEHQSAVSFGKIPEGEIRDSSEASMGLVWHEVSHEWWGNNVSCKDIADMWIHEAFAVYSERLPMKATFGEEGEQAYMADLPEQVVGKEPIIGVYDVNHIHYNIEDMYSKAALMLHTYKNVLNNDKLWTEILKGIQQDFRYKTVTTEDIVNYINTKTQTDYTYFFDQYLRYPSIPILQIKYSMKGEVLTVSYKWKADVPDFHMPVKVTKTKGKFEFIYPTSTWQTITLPAMEPEDFEVDEDNFYINVQEEEE